MKQSIMIYIGIDLYLCCGTTTQLE